MFSADSGPVGVSIDLISGSQPQLPIMRYELNNYEWSVMRPMLPNKPRGIPRVDDRHVLNGIFWVLRSGAPLARSAGELRSPYDLLLIASSAGRGRRLGPDHGCTRHRL